MNNNYYATEKSDWEIVIGIKEPPEIIVYVDWSSAVKGRKQQPSIERIITHLQNAITMLKQGETP